jgi:hypothetical protein
MSLELYALHQGIDADNICFLVLFFVKNDKECRLINELSITSDTAFISCLFADVTTADSGIPFLSVKSPFCLTLFASMGGITFDHRPSPNGDFMDMLSIDCHHVHLILFLLSYSFSNLIHIFLKVSIRIHS